MIKYKIAGWFIAGWFVTVAAGVCLTTAQNSQTHLSSTKSKPDSLQGATKPLTKKSAMPTTHKSSGAVPTRSASEAKTNAELSRLEKQNSKTPASKKPANPPPVPKPAATSNKTGSGINSTYQKPKTKN